jgi:hypothetical protein
MAFHHPILFLFINLSPAKVFRNYARTTSHNRNDDQCYESRYVKGRLKYFFGRIERDGGQYGEEEATEKHEVDEQKRPLSFGQIGHLTKSCYE